MIYLRAAIIILIFFGQTAIVQAADDITHAIETAKTVHKTVRLPSTVVGNVSTVVGLVSDNDDVVTVANVVGKTATVVEASAAVGTAATTGAAVMGASGPAIMQGLAIAGGPLTVAGGGGLGAATILNETVFDNCDDKNACDKAQYGTYVGAAAGTAASAGALAVAGAGPAGLAAIGGVVGGGMAAGVVTVVAAPVIAAAAVGGLVYWFFSD